MKASHAFRRSIYLTLALSSACLGYSEWDYLPEVTYFAGAILGIMLLAYWLDYRGKHLTIRQANIVGVMIFVVAVYWLERNFFDPDSLMNTLPWPAGGLPFVGPLLLLLIPAKLLRPKNIGDWWGLFGIGLASVGLAMALAEDGIFVGFVLAYAVSAAWCLMLFYYHRADQDCSVPRGRLWGALRLVGCACLISMPIFFLTPRTAGVPWELFHAKLETGLSTTNDPDLSRTGPLKLSKDTAFEVTASRRDRQPMLDLPEDLRFRGPSFIEYQPMRGRWVPGTIPALLGPLEVNPGLSTGRIELPDLGPDSYFLDFSMSHRVPVFADPVVFLRKEQPPIAIPLRNRVAYARQLPDSSFTIASSEFRFFRGYIQVHVRGQQAGTSFPLATNNEMSLLAPYRISPPTGVWDYAQRLLARLVADGELSPGILTRRNNLFVNISDYQAVAEAFRSHLADSGRFSYTLDLRRQDRNIDPMEDFLLNLRSGHCERFASALVLMLRAVGVPSQLVLGYRGCETIGSGQYRVRQDAAHAWAEVLLKRSDREEWYWQAFDPTPSTSASEIDEAGGLLETGTKHGQRFFNDYVINLNSDTQAKLTSDLRDFAGNNVIPLLGTAIAAAVMIYLARHAKRRRMNDHPKGWFDEIIQHLDKLGFAPVGGETPREYCLRARDWLTARGATDAMVPVRAAELLYRQSYAEEAIPEAEISAIQQDCRSLRLQTSST